jgi:hypothetical protein
MAIGMINVKHPRRSQISRRASVLDKLEKEEGDHLVVVRYSPHHPPDAEWLCNGADIDRSKVEWAREMGPAQNCEQVNYFGGRRTWLLEPDAPVPRLSYYAL